MTALPYQIVGVTTLNLVSNQQTTPMNAPKGKLPYVKFPSSGTIMGDSNLIYKHLISSGKIKDLDAHLTPLQKVHANAFRIFIEEYCHWLRLYDLWIANFVKTRPFCLSVVGIKSYILQVLIGWYARRQTRAALFAQGIGRHSEEEVGVFIKEAVEIIAGFIEGDELAKVGKETLAQASLFGLLLSLFLARHVSSMWIKELDKYPHIEQWTRKMAFKYYPERAFPE